MTEACRTPDCTVGDTGVCLLGNDPSTCEFRGRDSGADAAPVLTTDFTPPVLEAPEERPTLWGSLPLELSDLRELMASRNCLLVGVVGAPAAGKTAALVSMYLLLARGKLEGFQFADSRSLMALEEISQGARVWGENPPEEMTVRTETSGRRAAGFIHLRLKHVATGKLLDLLIPDLPGEWSDTLIDHNRTDRLEFIKASQVIWMFVNGSELRNNATRMLTLNRTKQLLRRVADMLDGYRPPTKIVVSHADLGPLDAQTVGRLSRMVHDNGLTGEVINIASFSNTDLAAGTGIPNLVASSIPVGSAAMPAWLDIPSETSGRFMLRYVGGARP